MDNNTRSLFRRREIIYIIALIVMALSLWFFFSLGNKGTKAVIEKGGKEIEVIVIGGELTREYSGVRVNFSPEGAKIISSPCTDKICVRSGTIKNNGESLICLPTEITVRIIGGGGYDSVTY